MEKHASHPEVLKRLRRVEGHLRGVIEMIEQHRACVELAQQLQAIESAVSKAKKTLIHDHIDNCLEEARSPSPKAAKLAMDEFRQITRYL